MWSLGTPWGRSGSILVVWARTVDSEGAKPGDHVGNPGAADLSDTETEPLQPSGSVKYTAGFLQRGWSPPPGPFTASLAAHTEAMLSPPKDAVPSGPSTSPKAHIELCHTGLTHRHTAPAHTASPSWAPGRHSGKSASVITSCTSLAFDYTPTLL